MKQGETSASPAPLDGWLRRVGIADAFVSLAALFPDAAVVVVDADDRVLHWSPGAERLLGGAAGARTGRPCPSMLLGGEARPQGARARLSRDDGATVLVRRHSRVFSGPDGPLGAVHVLTREERDADAAVEPVSVGDAVSFHGLVSRDPAMLRVFGLVRNVAETDTTVLVRGESGTGKELVARAIHLESPRRGGPFVAVNCASLTPTLLESELFGHVRGAFTGAVQPRRGIFAQADGGTLFLDEVAEIPLALQAKLLRVLQERSFVPVGGSEAQTVDVRVIAATHRALREEVRAGRFREDLLYRLRVVPLFLPALRERRLDVEPLLRHFLARYDARGPRHVRRVAPEALRALLDHPWPGNVRELQNVVEYAFAVGRGEELTLADLPPEFRDARPAPSAPARPTREDGELQRIERALAETGGDVTRAAALLGVSRTTFWRMRRRAEG